MTSNRKTRILHVDDREEHRYVVRRILERAGFECASEETGERGLSRAREETFDLVILDIQLPGMNGYEVCRLLKTDDSLAHLPVLHLTSHFTGTHDKVSGFESGADGYLLFPVDPLELVAQVRALLRIRESEERFRFLADSLPQKVWTASPDGQRTYLNKRWVDYTGRPARLGTGLGWVDVVHPSDRALALDRWNAAVRDHVAFEVEMRLRREDGTYRWHLCQAMPMEADGPTEAHWFGTCTDIETHKANEARQNFLGDAQGLLGSSLEATTIFKRLEHLAHLAVPRLATSFRVYLADGARILLAAAAPELDDSLEAPPEVVGAIRDGMARESERTICVPIPGRGTPLGALRLLKEESDRGFLPEDHAFVRDLCGRVASALENARLYEEARLANRAKDEFLATVSHELRTPLNVLHGYAELLLSHDVSPEETRRSLEAIQRNTVAQAQLVDDLLDVSRISSGKLTIEKARFGLARLVDDAIDAATLGAKSRGVALRADLGRGDFPIVGDRERLQQVVSNLLTNAIKFTPKDGVVSVTLTRRKAGFAIEVRDTGAGIEASFLPHVFERFRQEDSKSTRRFSGLGIGLSIVKYIVEAHGGRISATSAGKDLGASFVVELPTGFEGTLDSADDSFAAPEPVPTPRHAMAPSAFAGLHVVVIEDLEDSRDLISHILMRSGASVDAFDSARSARDHLEKEAAAPHVILCDISMPDEDGYSFLARLRQGPRLDLASIPVLALTAHAGSKDRAATLAAGFDAHLSKPFEIADLVAAVAALVAVGRNAEAPAAPERAGGTATERAGGCAREGVGAPVATAPSMAPQRELDAAKSPAFNP